MLRKEIFGTYRSGRQYKALALGKIPDWGWHLKDFKSKCLRGVAETFNWHLMRTSAFARLPAWVALEAVREQLWIDHATIKNGGSITSDLAEYVKAPLPKSVEVEFARLAKAYRSTDEEMAKALLEGIGMKFIENSIPASIHIRVGVEVIFESVVRESWTAFEDLSRELWRVVLDNDDGSVAGRVGRISKPFQSMGDIKKSYELAFGPTVIELFNQVETGYIHVLHAFRNVLVHRRGKADDKFRKQISNYPEFSAIKENDQIALNGEAVRKMRDSAMMLGRRLIELADAELQRQAAQKP